MAVKYNLVAKNGEYEDKNGEKKTRWTKVGVVMETKTGGLAAKIELFPIGWDGWCQLAEPEPVVSIAKEGAKANGYQKQAIDEIASDIPF